MKVVTLLKIMTYKKYQEIVQFGNEKDNREFYIQRRLIEPFIESIVPELHIEDVSVIRHNSSSSEHDSMQYSCGAYPDLLIVKEWNYFNVNNVIDYKAVVEVKPPFVKNEDYYHIGLQQKNETRIYTHTVDTYSAENVQRILGYFNATENNRVIFTDGLKWDFFDKRKLNNSEKDWINNLDQRAVLKKTVENKIKKIKDEKVKEKRREKQVAKENKDNLENRKILKKSLNTSFLLVDIKVIDRNNRGRSYDEEGNKLTEKRKVSYKWKIEKNTYSNLVNYIKEFLK